MEHPSKQKIPSAQWTEEFLRSKLSQLTGTAAAPALSPGSYHKAAAVLATFDPDSLNPFEPSTSEAADFDRLLADVTTIHDDHSRPASMLRSEVRKKTLAAMATPQKLKEALAANSVRPQTSLQKILEAYIHGSAPEIAQQNLDQLGATLQVIDWLPSGFPNLPKPEDVKRLVERESLLKPFRDLATENFIGRTEELRDLRIYVDFLPSQGALEAVQRFLSWDEKPPRIIYGPGGMGKSALISKFVLDHIAPKDGSRAIPFVFLDFDRPSLAPEEPRTLLMEAARQLAIQVPDLSTLAALRQTWIAQTTETSRPELSGMLSAFGDAFRASSVSGDPVLFVADTFEVVQYRGAEITAEVIGLLDSLRQQIPRLRAVISGRAPVNTPDYPTDNKPLDKLNVKDAAAYLTRQGVPPPVASKVAAQVGGSPLSLRLAIDVLRREGFGSGGIANLEVRDWLYRRLQDSLIQGQLYRRILDYIKDENVRMLAYPGLVLRRITAELIKEVLAGPCRVQVDDLATARKLFQGLQQEVSLVTPAEDGSLHHRPEVREAMLQLMKRDEPMKLRSIQTSAVDYYRKNARTDAEKAELLYHLAALGRPRSELEEIWELSLEKFLGGVLLELPPASRAFLAPLIHEPLDEEAKKHLAREDSERVAAQQARNFLLLERPEHALKALSLPSENPGAVILMLRAAALVQLGRCAEARDALDAAFLTAHEESDPHLTLKLEVLEARVLAQTARRVDVSLTEERRRQLQSALNSAFPTYDALQSVAIALGQQLQDICAETSPDGAALGLIRWTEETNLVEELIGAARRLNATHAALTQFGDAAGVDRAPTPSPARTTLRGQGLSYGRRLVDRYDELIKKFLDDPRLLRVGLYFMDRYRKRGAEEPRHREQLEDLMSQLFQRIAPTDLGSFGPLCLEVAGCLGPRKPELLTFVLSAFGIPELSLADRELMNTLLAEWDKAEGAVSKAVGTSWQQVVLQGDSIRIPRMLQQVFAKLGYFPALTEAIAAKMRAATSKVPEKALFEELERVSQFWTDATQLSAALADALNKFNWTEANNICSGVVARCRDAAIPFPAAPARQMLNSLRRKRQFALMEMLGTAFVATMPDNFQVHRQYAQALVDQGKYAQGETVLENILERTPPVAEEAEAKALLGRIEKQRYVDAPTAPGAGEHLLNSIRTYLEVYRSNPAVNFYQGINSVALIARAERDGLPVLEFPDSLSLAKEILAAEASKDDMYAWDHAIVMEASVAVGDYGQAQASLDRYISDPSRDAFELGSTLRQLREVWQLSSEQEPGATLLPSLQAALLQRQGGSLKPTSQEIASVVASSALSGPGPAAGTAASPTFQQLEWYRTGLRRAASIARIEWPTGTRGTAVGTGFLVKAADFFRGAPERAIILLTAAHVLTTMDASSPPALPDTAAAIFEVEAKACRLDRLLWISPPGELDAAFLAIEGLAADATYCPMPSASRKTDPQQRVYVIGYPRGGALSFSLQDGLLLDTDATRFHYRAATEAGSAGSPVFDGSDWTVLALHHARSPRMPMLNGKPGFYEAGEGISLRAIQAATLSSSVQFEMK